MKFISYLGIDISKKTLDCCLQLEHRIILEESIANKPGDIAQFFRKISKHVDLKFLLVCIEHTGIYSNYLLNFLQKQKQAVWVESGIQIKYSSGLSREKNDKVDARKIADYAYTKRDKVRLHQFPRKELTRLHVLTSTRERLLKMKNQITVPLKEQEAFLDKETVKSLKFSVKKALKGIADSLKEVEKEISELIKSDKDLKKQFKLITSVSGVGKVTATRIIVHTNEFKKITCPKKFSCYVGTAPFGKKSGTSIRSRPRVSSFAYKKLKALIHMCVLSNIASKKKDNKFKRFYERKIAEGKNKMSTLNAVRNKLIQTIFAVVRTNKPFDLNHQY